MPTPEKHNFQKINTDLEARYMQPGMYRYLLNGIVAASDGERMGDVENALGTTLINNAGISSGTVVGTFVDPETNTVLYFVTDNTIWQFNPADNTFTLVMSWSGFNFSNLISGVDVLNGNLIWTDGNNNIRKIHIAKAIAGSYPSPILEEDITLMRRAPRFPLGTTKSEDSSATSNLLDRDSFQFTYRYIYWDYEKSVFAPMSHMSFIDPRDQLNTANNNIVICTIPTTEDIRGTVLSIEWAFRVNNTNEFAIFKVTPPTVLTAIFKNDVAGATLADAEVLKPFDDVPLKATGLRAVQNRVFLNNYTAGYDLSELNIQATINPLASVLYPNQPLYERQLVSETKQSGESPIISISWVRYYWQNPVGNWFRVTVTDGVGAVDAGQGNGLPSSALDFKEEYFYGSPGSGNYAKLTSYAPTLAGLSVDIETTPTTDTVMFKAGDPYQVGVRFSDNEGRNNGVYTRDSARVTMPEHPNRDDMTASTGAISWQLGDDTEIPLWATHYEIVRTQNLSRSWFLQGQAGVLVYGKEAEAGDGAISTPMKEAWDSAYDIYLHIENSTKYKIGYVFSEGDRCKFFYGLTPYDVKIKGQRGPWLIIDNPFNSSSFPSIWDVFYEIYTPYLGSLEESFFEIGEKFAITDPGTASRAYSVTTGTLIGDIHRKRREIHHVDQNSYILDPEDERVVDLLDASTLEHFEAMNPNDDYYEQWVSDIGRATIVLSDVRQQDKRYTLKYGGNYAVDALINNVSSFNAGDEYPMPLENGPARALAATNNNLLYLHEREASSVYVNEGFLSTQDGGESLIRRVETVSDDRKLRLGHGTINPESVAEYADKAWWWNVFKGAVIRYSNEGLVALSDDGMKNYFYTLSRILLPYKEQSKVYGVYDPYLDYYILTFAPVPAAGYLGETFAFSEREGAGGVGWFSYQPEMYTMVNNTLFSFKDGQLWKHDDSDNCNTFYGVKYDRVIRFVANQEGNTVKIWANYRVDAESMAIDMDGANVLIKVTNEQGQEGRVYAHQIEEREEVFVGTIKQDVLTPNSEALSFNSPAEQEDYFMYNGDVLRSQVCEVEITNDRTDISPLYFVTLLYRKSEVSFK